ncbi:MULTISPECIES: flagellar motor protein MotB [Sphingomonadaceae]|uniref:flagellar motor protein MotB n=1 Tax=Sphingomonadaceae TaxID=41297 RepID=UPI00115BCC08|nr:MULTISPECIES: flagellar motor protein MotB [Sphingomonadaceae]QDK31384.1 flagellar motor protein MotB [Sphingomonas sp. IC081]QSR16301.1 flagellar motor protein MotB [Novosphingobium sp. KA1]
MAGNGDATIIIRKVRKKAHGAHHGGAWKVAYADFVTAMMAFFMLLWLLANPDKQQLKGLAEYFSPAADRDAVPTALTQTPGPQPGLGGHTRKAQAEDVKAVGEPSAESGVKGAARGGTADVPEAALRIMAQQLQLQIEPPIDTAQGKRNLDVEETRDGLRIHLVDSAERSMFKGGTAQLNPYARDLLARVARKLAGTGAQVAIEGHTDSTGGQSDANWMLSAQRALAARAAMVEAGLPTDRFAEVVAKAATEPVYPDRPDRPENRRITIVVMAQRSALPQDASFRF